MDATTMVGRDGPLRELEAALSALEAGRPGWVAIEGEPGIGKTRLLAELRARAEQRGHLVLSGAAAEFERDLPFGVWTDALDAHVASRDLAAVGGWADEVVADLAPVLPSLAARAAPGVADERFRTHRAVRTLLGVLSDEQALVLVLDDLHWADGASLELLATLVHRGVDAPVLVALAFRPGPAPDRLVAALAAPELVRVVLEPLSAAEAATLVGAERAPALYAHSGGNPFYLTELARAGGAPSAGPDRGGDGEIPAAVAAALAQELEALPAPSRLFLRGAAVAGEPFEPDLASAVAELPAAEGLAALDALLSTGLLRPTHVPRRFAFRHPLVRSAVYGATPGGWRLAAHARAADTLAARGADAADRARHVEQSAESGDDAAIALLLEAAASTAPRAPAVAERWYAAALRLLPRDRPDRVVDVLVALASAQRGAGELERCRTTLLDAIDGLPATDEERRVELTALCAAVEHWLGRHDEARARLVRAWERLPDRAAPLAAAVQLELAVDAFYAMDAPRAEELATGALTVARASAGAALTARAAAALALAQALQGATQAALGHRAEALALIDGLTDAELAPALEALYFLGWAENYLERYDDGVRHVDRGIAIARATGQGRLVIPMMLVKPYAFEMTGQLAEAREVCDAALEAARLAGNPHFLAWALYEKAWTHYYEGALEQTIAACQESHRVGQKMVLATMPASGGGPGWPLASARFLLGEPQGLLDLVESFGDDTLPWAVPVEKCFAWETMSLAAWAAGQRDRATDLVQRAENLSAVLDLDVPAGVAGRARASLLLATGEPAGAATVAGDALARLTRAGALLQAAFARHLLGRAQVAMGARADGVRSLRDTEHALDAMGSLRVRDEVRRELRGLGARVEPRGPSSAAEAGLEALSAREREIADLVTDRLTNKEVAGRLFLSEKTVESHLRNIMRKLGVSSRVAVARLVEQDSRDD